MSNCSFMNTTSLKTQVKTCFVLLLYTVPYNNRIFSSSIAPRVMMSWKINSKFPPFKCS